MGGQDHTPTLWAARVPYHTPEKVGTLGRSTCLFVPAHTPKGVALPLRPTYLPIPRPRSQAKNGEIGGGGTYGAGYRNEFVSFSDFWMFPPSLGLDDDPASNCSVDDRPCHSTRV